MNQNDSEDFTNYDSRGRQKMPTGINVLTILTFIGCAFELYNVLSSFLKGQQAITEIQEAQAKLADAPAWLKSFAGPEMLEYATKAYENRILLLILGLVAVGLCVFGAIQMRKLKKDGYFLWLAGELLPIIGVLIFFGPGFYGGLRGLFLFFPLLFIFLYTLNRSSLTR